MKPYINLNLSQTQVAGIDLYFSAYKDELKDAVADWLEALVMADK
ncbi:MAG: hypothetical protein WBN57_01080 [Gammaproteobacteria bacterium]